LRKQGCQGWKQKGEGTPEEEVAQAQNTWPVCKESSEMRQGRLGERQWVDGIGRGGIGSYKEGGLSI